MKVLLLLCALVFPQVPTQVEAVPPPGSSAVQSQLTAALVGRWTGVLEYRDFSEPPTSQKRVQLPTWLTIRNQPQGLGFEYV